MPHPVDNRPIAARSGPVWTPPGTLMPLPPAVMPGAARRRVAAVASCLLYAAAGAAAHAAADHSHHHVPAAAGGAKAAYARSVADYRLPALKLVRADGRRVDFPADMDDGRPVMLNFVYTTCTAICPVMSQIFSATQSRLGPAALGLRMISVSIDPEQDTPKRLAEYAGQYVSGPQWTFYTGTVEASTAIQKAFAAYRGDKMNHTPLTLLRAAPGKPWVRLDGLATPDDLVRELHDLMAPGGSSAATAERPKP